ncbi:hypothetical protein BC829DRAFT_363909, partial [Chytridium lagenaria]
LPEIRQRPQYKNLGRADNLPSRTYSNTSSEPSVCPKYYERQRKAKSLTAGAMVFLCRHRFYIGFHMFPSAESINDVFSTILTRFETCPSFCLADNNCHAADYCTLREFEFFKNCRFMIDDFHSNAHRGCSAASHAKHYRQHKGVGDLNTSYTESANHKMGIMRNMVSYMTEAHAIMAIQTFVCMANRALLKDIWRKGEKSFSQHFSERRS